MKMISSLWTAKIHFEKITVFTDLDGTLLDEQTYSADLSLPALRYLQSKKVDIVFCSSKTRKEQEVIRETLGVRAPFIVENGSAIIIPPNTVNVTEKYDEEPDGTEILLLGLPIEEIRATLQKVVAATGIAYTSFHNLSGEQIAEITGLDLESAKRAKARQFSETIVTRFDSIELETFVHECELHSVHCTFGGRFLSVMGKGADKGRAVQVLTKHYQAQFGDVITIGIGDSLNDVPMLEAVDFPYLVQRPDGQWRSLGITNLNYLPAIGPLGFSEMVKDIERRWFTKEG